ncbi:hypothetical protein ACFSKY_22705 [Azotobacter chroococcum]|uniref:Uncharacterized protein n=1 Tax=Azotobacter chroococcum TaxID=353 RepID=A0A4R1P831_9GAMM|nr:hypothetical protein [Azotobacter chroococcum]TBV95313.1 hypothetical protein E0E53_13165 [Azotobacter chroococcum]TCL22054.1 hypothetical protein EV691_1353 [Azotobacter chroococcum]
MKQQCIQAVQQAIGRSLNQPEIKDIEARIRRNMRQLAQTDPAWQTKTAADRMTEAASAAAKELQADAAKKKQRVALTILAHDRVANLMAQLPGDPLKALDRMLAFASDYPGLQSVESASRAIRDEAMSTMLDAIDMTRGKFLGLFADAEKARALVQELHGQDGGVPEAKVGAKQFAEVANRLRERFNRAGGDVGYLDDWAIPRSHSQLKVARNKDQWIADHVQWANRAKYFKEDGSRMTDTELTEFFTKAWETVATGGVNKLTPGQPSGGGARANRGSESRQIHYRDADAYLAAQAKYGDKGLMDLMFGHIDRAARDIALVEALGPNPNHAMRFHTETAAKEMIQAKPEAKPQIDKRVRRLEQLYTEVAGTREPPASAALSNAFDTYRNSNVFGKLGSAVITGLTDQGIIALTSKMNGMPVMQVFANELRMLNPADATHRRLALRAGLGIDQLVGSLARWGEEGLGTEAVIAGRASKWSQTAATATMRLSGMNAIDAGNRRAFGATMMDVTGDLTRRFDSLAALEPGDRRLMQARGITDQDWSVWRLAQPEDWRGAGDQVLTAGSIYRIPDADLAALSAQSGVSPTRLREQAATKLLGMVLDETNMAIPGPGAREKAFMHGNNQRGTWSGEFMRSFWQFKSFSVSMISKHFRRAMAQQTGWGKAGYGAALLASLTVLGAIALQLNEVASGKDPRNMLDDSAGGIPGLGFGMAAMLKGGALSLYGDFAFSNLTQGGTSALAAFGGPLAGDLETLLNLRGMTANAVEKGDVSNVGARLIQLTKGHLPGANLWYTKAATDHLIFHQLQEYFSPGYLSRMERRAQREFGQSYWWEPGEASPSRAPNLGASVSN